jgi:hypothetical protein
MDEQVQARKDVEKQMRTTLLELAQAWFVRVGEAPVPVLVDPHVNIQTYPVKDPSYDVASPTSRPVRNNGTGSIGSGGVLGSR